MCNHAQLVIVTVYLGSWLTFWAVSAGMLQHTQSDWEVIALMDVHGSQNYTMAFSNLPMFHLLAISNLLINAVVPVTLRVLRLSVRSWPVVWAEVRRDAISNLNIIILCMVWCWFAYLQPAFNRQKMVREMSFVIALLQLLWIKFPEVRRPDSQQRQVSTQHYLL